MPTIRPTFIGVAFYAVNNLPAQLAIVLSHDARFSDTVWSGSVMESVNGWGVVWKSSSRSPAAFEPYMTLAGVITVAEVKDREWDNIYNSICSLVWTAEHAHASRDSLKHINSSDYVRRVLLHLSNNEVIRLPVTVKRNIDGLLTDGLLRLREQPGSTFNVYPVISLGQYQDPVYGHTGY